MSRETQWRRLLIWTAVVVVVAVIFGVTHPRFIPSRIVLSAMSALASGAGFGAAAYCLALFVLERRVNTLFAAVAFSALGSGSVLQVIVDFRGAQYAVSGWIASAAWLNAAVLLLGAGCSQSVLRASTRLQSIRQMMVAGTAVAAFPIAVMPYVLDTSLPGSLNASVFAAAAQYRVDNVLGLIAALTMAAAIGVNHRRYMSGGDGLAGLLCHFLTASGAGLLFTAFSSGRFGVFSSMSFACFLGA